MELAPTLHSDFLKSTNFGIIRRVYGHFLDPICIPPSDFSRHFRRLYLTKQYQVAHEYAEIAFELVNSQIIPVGILQISIPIELLKLICEIAGDLWQKYEPGRLYGVSRGFHHLP